MPPPPVVFGARAGAGRCGARAVLVARRIPVAAPGHEGHGYLETRPVQSAVLPYALAGDDVIASAETGTGKTAAFVVPILQRLLNVPDQQLRWHARADPRADTRAGRADRGRDPGDDVPHDAHERCRLRRRGDGAAGSRAAGGGHVVVATPGRLMDHMRSATPDFSTARSAGARRSGPDDGHGLLARRPAHRLGRCRPSARRCSSRRRCRTKC